MNGRLFILFIFLIVFAGIASVAINIGERGAVKGTNGIEMPIDGDVGGGTDVAAGSGCVVSGCSGQICSEEEVITTCEYKPEYECYRDAVCERQEDGICGWTQTQKLEMCLDDV
jgi:eight-cysteine-cluster-containing protein